MVDALFESGHFPYPPCPWFTTKPDELDAWKKDRLGSVCVGTEQPRVVDCKPLRKPVDHGQLLRTEAVHDHPIFFERRVALVERDEVVAIVPDETLHRRRRSGRGCVVRGQHRARIEKLVGDRVDDAEQRGVDMLILLARIGIRVLHVGLGARTYPRRDVGVAVVDVRRYRIAVLLACESIERLVAGRWIRGLVAIAEQAVERAVLEHDHDHVIELRDRCRGGAELLLRVVVVVEAATQERRTGRSGQLQKVAPAGGDSIRENVGTARSGRGNVGRRLAHCHSASSAYLVARRLENLARSMTTRSCVPRPISSSPSIART